MPLVSLFRKSEPKPSILVGGLGRCGTTLIYHTIRKNNFRYNRMQDFVVDIPSFQFRSAQIYKTHDYAPSFLDGDVKAIFIFGNPMNAAVSAHKALSGGQHYKHVKSPFFTEHDRIFEKDVMLMEDHFNSWVQPQSFEFVSLRYEHIYRPEVQQTLCDFLGVKFKLPEFRKRSSYWLTHPNHDELANTYSVLSKKVEAADSIQIWAAK